MLFFFKAEDRAKNRFRLFNQGTNGLGVASEQPQVT